MQHGETWSNMVQDGLKWCRMVQDFARWCKMVQHGATKTSVNGPTRLNFRDDNLVSIARSYGIGERIKRGIELEQAMKYARNLELGVYKDLVESKSFRVS